MFQISAQFHGFHQLFDDLEQVQHARVRRTLDLLDVGNYGIHHNRPVNKDRLETPLLRYAQQYTITEGDHTADEKLQRLALSRESHRIGLKMT